MFDDIEYAGGGLVEVVLQIDDALATDDRAWTLIDEPRRSSVLLVTRDNMLLTNALSALAIDLEVMSPEAYESADDNVLTNGERSLFDVVMFDGHGTQRLPLGNYMFWGAVPMVEGVSAGDLIDTEIIFNWDDTHPILRHVAGGDDPRLRVVEAGAPAGRDFDHGRRDIARHGLPGAGREPVPHQRVPPDP